MPGRRPRWKRGDKFADERCGNCGGREFVRAIDNEGKAYPGCARCTVNHLPPEVLQKLQEEGQLPRALLVQLQAQDEVRQP